MERQHELSWLKSMIVFTLLSVVEMSKRSSKRMKRMEINGAKNEIIRSNLMFRTMGYSLMGGNVINFWWKTNLILKIQLPQVDAQIFSKVIPYRFLSTQTVISTGTSSLRAK